MKNLLTLILAGVVLSMTTACVVEEEEETILDEIEVLEPDLETSGCTNEEWIEVYIGCRGTGTSSGDCFTMVNDACSAF